MAVERLVSPTLNTADPAELERINGSGGAASLASLRPRTLAEYVGQPDLVQRLAITIQAVRERGGGEPMEHVLLHGPPGLGKTTLAHVIAEEMSAGGEPVKAHVTSGPALTKPGDLVGILTQLQPRDVLFIDEIHRTPIAVEEFIYPAMEDFKIDIKTETGRHAKTIQIGLKPFTLIGATTRAGLVSSPLRSRFGITHSLRYYTDAELLTILRRSAKLLGGNGGVHATDPALTLIAARSRGTPRIANRLLRRVRDFAQVKGDGTLTPRMVNDALALEGIDALGLDELDRNYLTVIARTYKGGPVGLEAVAATLNHDSGTLEDVVEPYLLQIGFLARTRRGRALTAAGAKHIGLPTAAPSTSELFGPDELPA
jgi:Holliday junction DNA helicase RuvB